MMLFLLLLLLLRLLVQSPDVPPQRVPRAQLHRTKRAGEGVVGVLGLDVPARVRLVPEVLAALDTRPTHPRAPAHHRGDHL